MYFICVVIFQNSDLRKSLQEKTELCEQKSSQVAALTSNKCQLDTQITQLMETLDIKDRKINVLQRKVRLYGLVREI